jgi:hypothetical protein
LQLKHPTDSILVGHQASASKESLMRQLLRSAVMISVLIPGLSTLLHAGVVTFDFEADITGIPTQFTDTISGLSATFSSAPDVVGFSIQAFGTFQSLTGNFLMDLAPETLTVVFSAPLTSISMNFATSGPATLSLDAFSGGTLVGSNSASGTVPAGFAAPEGILGFNSGTFDTVVLSASTGDFAVDNIAATDPPPDVPEPGSLLLCAGALAALSFGRLRRRPIS